MQKPGFGRAFVFVRTENVTWNGSPSKETANRSSSLF